MPSETCCQFTSPEMFVNATPSTRNSSKSKNASDESFHQNESAPGPPTVVCKTDSCKWLMLPQRAASTPSCVKSAWPNHGASPVDDHTNCVASSESPSGSVTVSLTGVLVTLP